MSNWTKSIKEIIRDVAIGFLINGTMISIPAAIQQKMTPDLNKFFGMIEMGVYEWIAIFLSSTALFLYFKRKQFGKYLDELTGRAKGKREHLEQLELIDRESKERLELDNRNRLEKQRKEAEEERANIEKRNRLLSVLKDDLFYEENKHNYTAKTKIYLRTKTIENLKKLGFLYPTDEEQGLSWFSAAWEEFLSVLIAKIEYETEKEDGNLYLWDVIKSKHQNLFKGTP